MDQRVKCNLRNKKVCPEKCGEPRRKKSARLVIPEAAPCKIKKMKKREKNRSRKDLDAEYRWLYDKVLAKHGNICAACGGKSPGIHHIDFVHENMVEENLIPLCWDCHKKVHSQADKRRTILPGWVASLEKHGVETLKTA